MHRLALFIFSVVVLLNKGCCEYEINEEKTAMLEECAKTVVRDPHSCDFQTCVAKKSGFMLSNGTIDKSLLEATIEKDFKNKTDIMAIVKEKCLLDNLEEYGPPHMCHIGKVTNCLHLYLILNCPQWKTSEHCDKVRDRLDDCESVFP
ncbi:jg11864 [Pararge aegeria aegeria]|uniref:Jg11864 protein n=1 Tax=Pararge aegeria aegeria TaxID=348720 RepID=A0A8S4SP29_9NEOP|nr:jg11864 [Pararge aegeria aegeria]